VVGKGKNRVLRGKCNIFCVIKREKPGKLTVSNFIWRKDCDIQKEKIVYLLSLGKRKKDCIIMKIWIEEKEEQQGGGFKIYIFRNFEGGEKRKRLSLIFLKEEGGGDA